MFHTLIYHILFLQIDLKLHPIVICHGLIIVTGKGFILLDEKKRGGYNVSVLMPLLSTETLLL